MTEQEIIDGGWIENNGFPPPHHWTMFVDIMMVDSSVYRGQDIGMYSWRRGDGARYITHWRLHKPEDKPKEDFKGLETAFDNTSEGFDHFIQMNEEQFTYPKTNYVTQSDEELKAAEKARVENKDDEMLEIVRQTVNSITQKNFSVADIALVANMLKVYNNYEENK